MYRLVIISHCQMPIFRGDGTGCSESSHEQSSSFHTRLPSSPFSFWTRVIVCSSHYSHFRGTGHLVAKLLFWEFFPYFVRKTIWGHDFCTYKVHIHTLVRVQIEWSWLDMHGGIETKMKHCIICGTILCISIAHLAKLFSFREAVSSWTTFSNPLHFLCQDLKSDLHSKW